MNKLPFHNNTVDINSLWYDSHKLLIEKITNELDLEDRFDELVENFLGKEIKFKKLRDPNAPKRPKTGYMYFCQEFRGSTQKKHPDLRMGGISKELGKLWGTYSPEDKEPYNDKSMVDRNRYDEEIEEYNLNNL